MTTDHIANMRNRRTACNSDLLTTLQRAVELSGRQQYLHASILLAHAQALLGRLQELSDAIDAATAQPMLSSGVSAPAKATLTARVL